MFRDRTVSALVVLALGLTLGAAVCVWAFTDLIARQPLLYPQADRLVVAQQVIFDPESARAADPPVLKRSDDQYFELLGGDALAIDPKGLFRAVFEPASSFVSQTARVA